MRIRDYKNENSELRSEINNLRKQLPLKTFEIRTSNGDEVEVKGHGFHADHGVNSGNIVNVWVHPWSNVAVFNNPVYIKEK